MDTGWYYNNDTGQKVLVTATIIGHGRLGAQVICRYVDDEVAILPEWEMANTYTKEEDWHPAPEAPQDLQLEGLTLQLESLNLQLTV